MKPAHTILELPEHIERVPAFYRKNPLTCLVDIGRAYQGAISFTSVPAIEVHIPSAPSKLIYGTELIACAALALAIMLLLTNAGI